VLHHFAGKPRFLHFDLSRDADAKLLDWVAPWVTLGDLPPGRGIESAAESSAEIDALAEDLRARARRPRRRPGRPDPAFVDAVVAHCLGTVARGGDNAALSPAAAVWRADGSIACKDGRPLPLRRVGDGPYLADRPDQARDRVQAVVNGLLDLGARPPLTLDMQDAREAGAGGRPPPSSARWPTTADPVRRTSCSGPCPAITTSRPRGVPAPFPPTTSPSRTSPTCACGMET
jgi:hypothetical protein